MTISKSDEAVWFFVLKGEAAGPVGWKELLLKMVIHHLNDQTLVWQPAFSEWRPFGDVKKEFSGYGRSEFSELSGEMIISSASLNPSKAIALAKIDTESLTKKSPYYKDKTPKVAAFQNEESKIY